MKFTVNYIPEKHNSKPNYGNRMVSYSDVVIRRPFKNMSSGEGEVGFLVKVKEMLENPEKMLFGAKDPVEVLLGL